MQREKYDVPVFAAADLRAIALEGGRGRGRRTFRVAAPCLRKDSTRKYGILECHKTADLNNQIARFLQYSSFH